MNKVLTALDKQHYDLNSCAATLKKLLADKAIGFTQIPARPELFETSGQMVSELQKNYKQFLVVGIGGSSMGSRALVELSATKNIFFLDNVDTVEFERVWSSLQFDLVNTAFIFVSKSGSTIEILWNYSLLDNLMKNLLNQSFFISEDTASPLAELARKNKRPLLAVPLDIGGRFSVLTPVGLVVAGLCGYSLNDMKAGASLAVQDEQAVSHAAALFLESFKRGEIITLFWFYNSAYRWFGAWLQQLWAESLGKAPSPGFSTPITAIGACDQHSILQQVAEGPRNKLVCFYNFTSVEKSRFEMSKFSFTGFDFVIGKNYGELISTQSHATQEALMQNGVSTVSFQVNDENSSFSLGYLFMYFQLVVAILGLHENINPFDQPGVTLGKDLTIKKLKKD